VFESQVPNQSITFTANPSYHEGPPKVGSVKMLNMPDETTLGLAIEKGEVHIGNLRSTDMYQKYKDTPTSQALVMDRFNLVCMMLNTRLKPLDNVEVRKALALAVNAPELVEGIFSDSAEVASPGLIHPKMLGYTSSIKPLTPDSEKAKSMLAAAGASNLSLGTVTYTGSEWTTVLALLQQQFARSGVNLKFEQLERATLNQRRAAPETQSVLISFTTGPDPDRMMSYLHGSQLPPDGINYSWYNGADAQIDQSRQEADQAKRARAVEAVQAKFAADTPAIPLYYNKNMVILSKKIKGYEVDPFGGHWLYLVSFA
jgi:dipeptide transport system substrate-binding protein